MWEANKVGFSIIITVAVLSLVFCPYYFKQQRAYGKLELTASELQENITNLNEQISVYKAKSDFLDKKIALITPSGKKFHTYDCNYLQDAEKFLAYNVLEATNKGYEACSVCIPDNADENLQETYTWMEESENSRKVYKSAIMPSSAVLYETFCEDIAIENGLVHAKAFLDFWDTGIYPTFSFDDKKTYKVSGKALNDYYQRFYDLDDEQALFVD